MCSVLYECNMSLTWTLLWPLTGCSGQTECRLQPPSVAGQQGPRYWVFRSSLQEEWRVSPVHKCLWAQFYGKACFYMDQGRDQVRASDKTGSAETCSGLRSMRSLTVVSTCRATCNGPCLAKLDCQEPGPLCQDPGQFYQERDSNDRKFNMFKCL